MATQRFTIKEFVENARWLRDTFDTFGHQVLALQPAFREQYEPRMYELANEIQAQNDLADSMEAQFAGSLDALVSTEYEENFVKLLIHVETFKQSVNSVISQTEKAAGEAAAAARKPETLSNLAYKPPMWMETLKKHWLLTAIVAGGLVIVIVLWRRRRAPGKLADLRHEPPYERPPQRKKKMIRKHTRRAPRKKRKKTVGPYKPRRRQKARTPHRFKVSVVED